MQGKCSVSRVCPVLNRRSKFLFRFICFCLPLCTDLLLAVHTWYHNEGLSLRWTLSPQPPCQETAPYLALTQWEPSFQQATNSHLQNMPAHPFCKHTKWVIGHTNAYLHCNLAFVYTVMDFFHVQM